MASASRVSQTEYQSSPYMLTTANTNFNVHNPHNMKDSTTLSAVLTLYSLAVYDAVVHQPQHPLELR